jgi:ribonuclease I
MRWRSGRRDVATGTRRTGACGVFALSSLLVLQSAVSGSARASGAPVCNPSTFPNRTALSFDMLVLALQWPFSVCTHLGPDAGYVCMSPPASFIVQGLWPANVSGDRPRCCGAPLISSGNNGGRAGGNSAENEVGVNSKGGGRGVRNTTFALGRIIDLEPQLRRMWPDLSLHGSAASLWSAQWQKHGTCSRFTVRGYFRKVLELARRFDFMRAMSAEGIVASAQRRHKLANLQRAVNYASGGFAVRLECRRIWKGTILISLLVCFDADGFRAVDCPTGCATGDDRCCHTGELIQIPYWSRETNIPPENGTGTAPADDGGPSGVTDAPSSGNYWAGQIVGLAVVIAGVAIWLFKQFFEQRGPLSSSLENQYVRIA